MLECRAGTLVSAVDVTGTAMIPKPTPAMPMVQPTVPSPAWGDTTWLVRNTPSPASTHPVINGTLDPTAPTQRPLQDGGHDHPHQQREEVLRQLVRAGRRDDLEIERDEEEDRQDREVAGHRDEVGPGERRAREDRDANHRMVRARLDEEEGDDGHDRHAVEGQDAAGQVARVSPAIVANVAAPRANVPRRNPT